MSIFVVDSVLTAALAVYARGSRLLWLLSRVVAQYPTNDTVSEFTAVDAPACSSALKQSTTGQPWFGLV